MRDWPRRSRGNIGLAAAARIPAGNVLNGIGARHRQAVRFRAGVTGNPAGLTDLIRRLARDRHHGDKRKDNRRASNKSQSSHLV